MALTVDRTINPIKVTGTTNVTQEIIADLIFIKQVYWYAPTTVGHICSLKNKVGNDILIMACETGSGSLFFPLDTTFDGIYCDDMDSGTLYVYH